MQQNNTITTVISRIVILSSPLWLNDFYMQLLPQEAHQLRLVLDLIFYIGFQSILIYMAWQAGWFKLADINIDLKQPGRQLLQGVAIFLFVFAVAILLGYLRIGLNSWFGLGIKEPGHPPMPEWSGLAMFFYVFYLAITAGIYEEIIYRAIIINQLENISRHLLVLAIGSALVFSLIHWSLGLAIMSMAFLFGIFWALIYIRTRLLLPVMLAHFMFDFVTFYDWHLPLYRMIGILE